MNKDNDKNVYKRMLTVAITKLFLTISLITIIVLFCTAARSSDAKTFVIFNMILIILTVLISLPLLMSFGLLIFHSKELDSMNKNKKFMSSYMATAILCFSGGWTLMKIVKNKEQLKKLSFK